MIKEVTYPNEGFNDDGDEYVDENKGYEKGKEEEDHRSKDTICRPKRLEIHLVYKLKIRSLDYINEKTCLKFSSWLHIGNNRNKGYGPITTPRTS